MLDNCVFKNRNDFKENRAKICFGTCKDDTIWENLASTHDRVTVKGIVINIIDSC